jgi:hypothetical protein
VASFGSVTGKAGIEVDSSELFGSAEDPPSPERSPFARGTPS